MLIKREEEVMSSLEESFVHGASHNAFLNIRYSSFLSPFSAHNE